MKSVFVAAGLYTAVSFASAEERVQVKDQCNAGWPCPPGCQCDGSGGNWPCPPGCAHNHKDSVTEYVKDQCNAGWPCPPGCQCDGSGGNWPCPPGCAHNHKDAEAEYVKDQCNAGWPCPPGCQCDGSGGNWPCPPGCAHNHKDAEAEYVTAEAKADSTAEGVPGWKCVDNAISCCENPKLPGIDMCGGPKGPWRNCAVSCGAVCGCTKPFENSTENVITAEADAEIKAAYKAKGVPGWKCVDNAISCCENPKLPGIDMCGGPKGPWRNCAVSCGAVCGCTQPFENSTIV